MITSRYEADAATRKKVLQALVRVVGPERATDNPAVLYSYSGTSMAFPKAMPDFLVRPRSTEEVQKIVAVARKHLVPITPVASGTQEAGTYPWFGGIVLDTMAMDQLVEINEEGYYAVVEPGVTIGTLTNALAKKNLRATTGSFPPGISALGNYLMTAVNSHRSAGPLDDIVGLEAVLADSSVVRTGSRAWSHTYPNTGWHAATNSFPNPKNLFIDAAGTLGIVTRAAVRVYTMGEARALPIAAFRDYQHALSFMLACARGNLVQHICGWHWSLYSIIDHLGVYGKGAPAEVLVHEPWIPPDNRPYMIVAPSIAGFRETVAAAEIAFRRLAAEHGGWDYTEELKSKWPGAHTFLADHYRDHKATTQFMGGYGEGFPMMPIVIGDPRKMVELEAWGLRFLRNSDLKLGLSYYSHVIDYGRAIFLRMTPFISGEATKTEMKQAAAIRRQYMEQAYARYSSVPIRFDYGYAPGALMARTGGLKTMLSTIKYSLDPDNIINSGTSIAMYGPPKAGPGSARPSSLQAAKRGPKEGSRPAKRASRGDVGK
jgi:FAD/FMN-containing dehydrogenase